MKDNLTSHLEKSIISNILQTARASLKEPSRPYTPSEAQRSLFANDFTGRPPSSYNFKQADADMRKTRRSSSKKLRGLESEEVPSETQDILKVLKQMQSHKEVRNLYECEDLEELSTRVTKHLEELKTRPKKNSLLKEMTLALEAFSEDLRKLMKLAKCVIRNLVTQELLFKEKSGTVKASSLALSVVKLLYQYSKNSKNDQYFEQEVLLEELHRVLVKAVNYDDLPYELLIFVLGTIKNLTANSKVKQQASEINVTAPLASFLPSPYLDSYPQNPKYPQLLVQVTGALRNLAVDQSSYPQIILFHVVEKLVTCIEVYKSHSELVLNSLRTLGKLSVDEKVCQILNEEKTLLCLNSLYSKYSENPSILTRVSYILANVVTIYEESRLVLGEPCVKNTVDYAILKHTKTKNSDVLVKSVRLVANIIIHPQVGSGLGTAEKLVQALCELFDNYNYNQHEELILNTVSCLTNVLFYDCHQTQLISDNLRTLLLTKLCPLMVQTLNAEMTCEALRALGNLTRFEYVCKELPSLHLLETLYLLLDHPDNLVLYYALGCFTNLSSLAKHLIYAEHYFEKLVTLLENLALEDPEVSVVVCMVLSNMCAATRGMVPWESVAGEDLVKRLTSCLQNLKPACEHLVSEGEPLEDLESLVENLLEVMPKPLIPCPVEGCGRKFPTQQELDQHTKRRH